MLVADGTVCIKALGMFKDLKEHLPFSPNPAQI